MVMKKKKKKKPMGGLTGKPANTEPRVQLFSQFGGCNFQMSPRDFDYIFDENADQSEQTDLMSNLMVIQNNALVTANKTIETRPNIITLFDAPTGTTFTGVVALLSGMFYAATADNVIRAGLLPDGVKGTLEGTVSVHNNNPDGLIFPWTFIGRADDSMVAMSSRDVWVEDAGILENATPVPDPTAPLSGLNLSATGLTTSSVKTVTEPYRITLMYTLLNKFGPTMASPPFTFYASKPTSEWTTAAYITLSGAVSIMYDITGIELYFTEGDAQSPNLLAKLDTDQYTGAWSYVWTGYVFDPEMWATANLTLPTRNYTSGPVAGKLVVLDGRLYFYGGYAGNRIYIGGNPGNRFSVSVGTGGGYVDVDPGSQSSVTQVLKFKTQQGASIVTALCNNPNTSKEHRFNLVETNIALSNEQSVRAWQAEMVAGTVGCKSEHGAVVAGDGLYAVSRYGLALTTLTMEYNSQIQIEYVSDAIEPVFLKQQGANLYTSVLFFINNILYMTFGTADSELDNVLFCYDVDLMAWWTYTLDIDEPILNMIHIDHHGDREGVGIITANHVYLLPTTRPDDIDALPTHEILIESAELSSMSPLQAMHHLTQLEFRFDYFIGEMDIIVKMIDQFGRRIEARKHVLHETLQHHLSEYMRIDAVVESYKIVLKGPARMRLTHFLSKSYPKSNRIGMAWGFDNRMSHSSPGSIHRTFASYNDLKEAIIP